jgi:hypothetical protein
MIPDVISVPRVQSLTLRGSSRLYQLFQAENIQELELDYISQLRAHFPSSLTSLTIIRTHLSSTDGVACSVLESLRVLCIKSAVIEGQLSTYIHTPNLQSFTFEEDSYRNPRNSDTTFRDFFCSMPDLKEVYMVVKEVTDFLVENLGKCPSLCSWSVREHCGKYALRKVHEILMAEPRNLFPSLIQLEIKTESEINGLDLQMGTTSQSSRGKLCSIWNFPTFSSRYGLQYQYRVVDGSQ